MDPFTVIQSKKESNMKILIIDNSELVSCGSDFCVETRTGNFALELQNIGNEVSFFGQKLKPVRNTVHVFGIKMNGMKVYGLWRKKNKIVNYFLLYFYAINYILNSDFVYIFYPNAFRYLSFLCLLFGKPFGIYIRGVDNLNDVVSRIIYRNAKVVLTVSDMFSNVVNNYVGTKKSLTIRPMIPFGVDDVVKYRKYTNKEKYKIIYLGRIAKDKGLAELVHSFSIIRKYRDNIELDIIGDGEYFKDVEKLIFDLSLGDIVKLKGPFYDSTQIKSIYLNSDLFILPSYHEGFPRTIYEAMIFGTPIITTFVGGIPNLMVNNYNCYKIEPYSTESIVEVLDEVLANYEAVDSIVSNAIKTVNKVFSEKKLSHAECLNEQIIKFCYE
jgi:glycosyltransferase involved in cell wall biosynthesis